MYFYIILLTIFYIVFFPPRFLFYQYNNEPRFYFENVKNKTIAITIDDSPNPISTPRLLNLFKQYNIKATFFVIGENAKKYPYLIREIIEQGHEIGNHDLKDRKSVNIPIDELIRDVKVTQELIGIQSKWFRPGCGFFSKIMINKLREQGYETVLGDTYSFDPQIPFFLWNLLHTLLKATKGSIIILHDGNWLRGYNTFLTLKYFIPIYQKLGYEFNTLSFIKEKQKIL